MQRLFTFEKGLTRPSITKVTAKTSEAVKDDVQKKRKRQKKPEAILKFEYNLGFGREIRRIFI